MPSMLTRCLMLATLALAATTAGAAATPAPPPLFDCVAQYFGPLQPVVTAVCAIGH